MISKACFPFPTIIKNLEYKLKRRGRTLELPTIDLHKQHWDIHDVILLSLVAIFFGIVYQGWNYVYYLLSATPLKPYANDLTLGVWLMAGPLSAILLKKHNACVIGEVLAAVLEMFLFSSWGASTIISGIIQGIGSELGFALTRYRHFDWWGLFVSSITATIVTFIWDLFQNGYRDYPGKILVILFVIRLFSILVMTGILVSAIQKLLVKTKVINQ